MSIEVQIVLLIVLSFYAGLFIGFLLKVWLNHRTSYDGSIVITRDREKTLYSLELEDDVNSIEFKKELILKVKSPE